MKAIFIITSLLTFSFFSSYEVKAQINGVLINYYNQKPIIFAEINLYLNGELYSGTISDFDGRFHIPTPQKTDTNDTYKISFEYAGNFLSSYQLYTLSKTRVYYKLKTDTSLTDNDIIKWRKQKTSMIKECGTENYLEEIEHEKIFEY